MSEDLSKMSKSELMELVEKLNSRKGGSNRGEELLSLLAGNGVVEREGICDSMGVKSTNLSSIICGLKKKDEWKKEFILISYNIKKVGYIELIKKGDEGFDRMVKMV